MRSSFLATAVLIAGLVPSPAIAEPSLFPALPTETIVLSNGLRVLLAPDAHATLVSVEVTYHAGLADDPNGRRGLAHLTEHLVAAQTKHVPAAMRTLASEGGINVNATTTVDKTRYYETVPPERLETALWVESDRMGYASDAVSEARLVSERATVHNEELQRFADASLGAVAALARHELFPAWHPYYRVADGDDECQNISVSDVRAFLATWYTPRNATLVVAGRFDREQAFALVKRYFEPLPGLSPPERPPLPAWEPHRVELVVAAAVVADEVIFEWYTPAYGTPDDAALDVAAAALTGPGNARFSKLIDAHLTTGVRARQISNREGSVFHLEATCAPGVDPKTVAAAVTSTIESFAKTVSTSEISAGQTSWRFNALRLLETTQGRANTLAGNDVIGASSWGFTRYESLTDRDVARAVSAWLRPTGRVAVTIRVVRAAHPRGVLLSRHEVAPE